MGLQVMEDGATYIGGCVTAGNGGMSRIHC